MLFRLLRIFVPLILLFAAVTYGVGRLELLHIIPVSHLSLEAAHASMWTGHAARSVWSLIRRIAHV